MCSDFVFSILLKTYPSGDMHDMRHRRLVGRQAFVIPVAGGDELPKLLE